MLRHLSSRTRGLCPLATLSLFVFAFSNPPTAFAATQVSQFGITWTFDGDYPAGQFANGDYWVVGPVDVVQIDPPSAPSGGRTRNGSMLNPSGESPTQGYDSAMLHNAYDPAVNVALGVSDTNPLELAPHSTLVSSISEGGWGVLPQVRTAAVLTVLGAAPAPGSFRPPYVGNDKTIRFNKSDLNYDLLLNLDPVAYTGDLADVEALFERPWLDHIGSWRARYLHPAENMENYGRDIARDVGIGSLMLHLDFSASEKETLLVRFVQLGIDLFGIVENGGEGNWTPDGGHASGRKWPILFAGHMLDDPAMSDVGFRTDIFFGEDAQTFYVEETSPGVYNNGYGGYAPEDVGLPEWGIRHATHPEQDAKDFYANVYRLCCTANAWNGFVLAAHLMDLRADWNHEALFDYMDRYVELPDIKNWERTWSSFTLEMWKAYRPLYGDAPLPTATPTPDGGGLPTPTPTQTPTPVPPPPGSVHFVDPVSGNDANSGDFFTPWKTIAHAVNEVEPGHTVFLREGVYGTIDLSGQPWSDLVTWSGFLDETAELDRFIAHNSTNIRLLNVQIGPAPADEPCVEIGSCMNIEVSDSEIFSLTNPTDYAGMDDGVVVTDSAGVRVTNNSIYNVRNGFHGLDNIGCVIEGNTITNMRIDGIQTSGTDITISENKIHDSHPLSGDHSDGIQLLVFGENIVVRNNEVYDVPQGILANTANLESHHFFKDLRIEGNLIYGGFQRPHYHYLSLYGAVDPVIVGNTIVGNPDIPGTGQIMLSQAGSIPTVGAIVRNNIAPRLSLGETSSTLEEDFNLFYGDQGGWPCDGCNPGPGRTQASGSSDLVGVDPEFVDPDNRDYRLSPTSPAVDGGDGLSSDYDLDGRPRPQGWAVDIGAYEYEGFADEPRFVKDTDGDGVFDHIEINGPERGDANRDGIGDSLQPHVATLKSASSDLYVSFVTLDDSPLKNVTALGEIPEGLPHWFVFPVGLFQFEVQNFDEFGRKVVAALLPEGIPFNSYYTFGTTQEEPEDHWYEFLYDGMKGASFTGNTAILVFDETEDGLTHLLGGSTGLVDKGGPAIELPSAVDNWGLYDSLVPGEPLSK